MLDVPLNRTSICSTLMFFSIYVFFDNDRHQRLNKRPFLTLVGPNVFVLKKKVIVQSFHIKVPICYYI